jgi:hypothetical protein
MWVQGKGLNVRPFPPELREELRGLALDAGQSLYLYVIEVLRGHVEASHRPWATTPGATEDATR